MDLDKMARYCVVCKRAYGPHWQNCCVEGSLVAITEKGFTKKSRLFFSLTGEPLTTEQIDELKKASIEKKKLAPSATQDQAGAAKSPVLPPTSPKTTIQGKQPMLRARTNCTPTIYKDPQHSAKTGELAKGTVFGLVSVQREREGLSNSCRIQTDDGRSGYVNGTFISVSRECSATREVPIYDADKIQTGTLTRGAVLSAWLPPDTHLGETVAANDWIQVERGKGTEYVCGIRKFRVQPLPWVGPKEPSSSVSGVKELIGVLAILAAFAAVGFFALLKGPSFVSDLYSSQGLYGLSSLIIGTWLGLKVLSGRRK